MAFLQAFGSAVPARVVSSAELGARLGVDADWIVTRTGIRERRWAAPGDSVVSLGTEAARRCLASAQVQPADVGMLLVASGSADRLCPGPAASIAAELGLGETPALDLPIASAGSLAGLVLAARLAASTGPVLVVGAEVMSRRIDPSPEGRDTAALFGDGAGAALVSPTAGFARVADSVLGTDGTLAEALRIEPAEPGGTPRIHMDGSLIIRHALRRMPAAIRTLLDRNALAPEAIGTYILHQANLNLLGRIARDLGVPIERFAANIDRLGNTSSASMLIAADEWRQQNPGPLTAPLMFSAFGAGLNWGALLATPTGAPE